MAGEGGRERALRFGHQETTGCQGPAELPRDPESLPRSPSKAKAQTRTRGVHVDFTTKDTCARIQNKMCVRTDSQTALAMRATCCKERPPKQSRSHGALQTPRTVGASQAPGSAGPRPPPPGFPSISTSASDPSPGRRVQPQLQPTELDARLSPWEPRATACRRQAATLPGLEAASGPPSQSRHPPPGAGARAPCQHPSCPAWASWPGPRHVVQR